MHCANLLVTHARLCFCAAFGLQVVTPDAGVYFLKVILSLPDPALVPFSAPLSPSHVRAFFLAGLLAC